MNWRDHIHSDPGVLGGKPVIRGTRISVELILEYFAEGGTVDDVLVAYPHINADQVKAAITFAHDLLVDDAKNAPVRRLTVRLLVDENVHVLVVAGLRDRGVEVEWIAQSSPSDQDETILGRVDIADWILLTYDSDFGDLIFNHGLPVPAALIFSRLSRLKPQEVVARILAVLDRQPLLGHLVVLGRDGDRYKSWMDR